MMDAADTDVAIYIRAPLARVCMRGTLLELHLSENGVDWDIALRADAGEATPIVSRILRALEPVK